MVSEIRLYVEGGGDGTDSRNLLRTGLGTFLNALRDLARSKQIRWTIIPCGGRDRALDNFRLALATHPHAVNILLVDSEGPVQSTPWRHLQQRDGWTAPAGVTDDQCQLMAQAMEAWLIADPANLERFYKVGFKRNALPRNADVEQIDRQRLMTALQSATRGTSPGEYHKIRHGPTLLAQTDPQLVRRKARHCDRLFTTVEQLIGQGSD